jgi:hypothetical protein
MVPSARMEAAIESLIMKMPRPGSCSGTQAS